jgi:uncharacterized membrane protein YhaH (DUF805 family)
MTLTQLLFSFHGRINRAIYWWSNIGLIAILLAIFILTQNNGGIFGEFGLAFAFAALFPCFWAGLAINAKRLHDRGKSTWWLLLFILVPTILDLLADRSSGQTALLLRLISLLIAIWLFAETCLLAGTPGPNRYGPDPLAPPEPA